MLYLLMQNFFDIRLNRFPLCRVTNGVWKSIVPHKTKLLVSAGVLLAVLIGLLPEFHARKWEKRWSDFFDYWKAQGEIFDPELLLPPDMGEDDEFAKHPWVRLIAEGDASVLETLARMEPENVEGYAEWHATTDDDGIHHPMPADLADRVIRHAAAFQPELDAFAEAVRRPGSRISSGSGSWFEEVAYMTWITRLAPVRDLLGAAAHAASSRRNAAVLTNNIETLLRAGFLLRSSNITLDTVIGSGFETAAFEAIRSLEHIADWPEDARRAWLAALDLRTRTPSDEFAACSRYERATWLLLIDEASQNRSQPVLPKLTILPPLRRAFIARAKLAASEALQEMVLSENGRLVTDIDPARVTRYEEHIKPMLGLSLPGRPISHPADMLGMTAQFSMQGVHDALLLRENERIALRETIVSTLP
ncbi:MAG TPA: hypothetical protein VLO11_03170 [Luteolibacter sp.]|nr:hypothetical protein [Luteolibacter sp.]